jgi:hypothetical protein
MIGLLSLINNWQAFYKIGYFAKASVVHAGFFLKESG